MAKFQKIDQKQLPLVVVLVVGCLGLFGWAALPILAPAKKAPAAPAAKKTTTPGGEEMASGQAVLPLGLPTVYNPDPFKPARQKVVTPPPPPPPVTPPEKGPVKGPGTSPGGPLRGPGPGPGPIPPVGPEGPQPPVPARPDVAITGIIDAEGNMDMALGQLGAQPIILRVGDKLPGDYRVAKILLDGIWLANGRDRYFVALGNKTPAPSAAAGQS